MKNIIKIRFFKTRKLISISIYPGMLIAVGLAIYLKFYFLIFIYYLYMLTIVFFVYPVCPKCGASTTKKYRPDPTDLLIYNAIIPSKCSKCGAEFTSE